MQTIREILTGQQGLAGVQDLLSGRLMEERLLPALRSLLHQPAPLVACRLQRAKLKPGRKLTGYYDLDLHDQSGVNLSTHLIAVTWTLPSATETVHAPDRLPAETASPFRQLRLCVPAWGLQIHVAPLDPRFPHLAHLADHSYVRKRLAVDGAAACDYRITPIRYRPGQRHVLRYDPLTIGLQPGPGTLFAKLYPDTSGEAFFARLNQIADWFATGASQGAILRPHVYLPKEQTILYPWAAGAPLSALLYQSIPNLFDHLTEVGRALRTLHDLDHAPATLTQGLPVHELGAEIKAIRRTCEHITLLLPDVGQTIQTLLQRAHAAYVALPQEAPTLVHGDFKADHVLVGPAQLTLIDFDSCALADPALDIGKFLADLTWWYAVNAQPGVTEAHQAFLAGYTLDPTHPRLRRAWLWATLILVKMTAHRVPLFDADWASYITAMIDRSVALLHQ